MFFVTLLTLLANIPFFEGDHNRLNQNFGCFFLGTGMILLNPQ